MGGGGRRGARAGAHVRAELLGNSLPGGCARGLGFKRANAGRWKGPWARFWEESRGARNLADLGHQVGGVVVDHVLALLLDVLALVCELGADRLELSSHLCLLVCAENAASVSTLERPAWGRDKRAECTWVLEDVCVNPLGGLFAEGALWVRGDLALELRADPELAARGLRAVDVTDVEGHVGVTLGGRGER